MVKLRKWQKKMTMEPRVLLPWEYNSDSCAQGVIFMAEENDIIF